MLHHLRDRENRLHTRIQLREDRHPLVQSLGGKDLGDLRLLLPPGFPGLHSPPVPPDQVFPSYALAEVLKELRLDAAHAHVAPVPRPVAVIERPPVEEFGLVPRILATHQILRGHHGHVGDGAIRHRDIDVLAFAGPVPMDHRGQDAHDRVVGAAPDVCELIPLGHRPLAGPAGNRVNPGDGQVVDVVAGPKAVGPVLAVPCEGTVDQAFVLPAQGLVVKAQPLHHTRPKLLEHDVVGPDEPLDESHPFRGLQVQGDRSFVPVERHVTGRDLAVVGGSQAHVVRPTRSLDLEDFGAEVAQHHRREGTGIKCREIKYLLACKRSGHGRLPPRLSWLRLCDSPIPLLPFRGLPGDPALLPRSPKRGQVWILDRPGGEL